MEKPKIKDQLFAPAADLKAEFDSRKEKTNAEWQTNGAASALESLSRGIKDLQDIGLNIRFEPADSVLKDAHTLVETIARKSWMDIQISGVLKVDDVGYLLAIGREYPAKATIYLSQYPLKEQEGEKIVGEYFSMEYNDAIHRFQQHIMAIVARREIISEHDVCGVFEHEGIKRLNKPAISRPVPKPDHP